MESLNKKTKEELINLVKKQEEEIEELRNDVDYWQKEYDDMEEAKEDLDCKIADLEMKGGINDLENFVWRLKIEGFYCDKLQGFINDYVRYHND